MTAIGRRPEAKVKPVVGHIEKREPGIMPVRVLQTEVTQRPLLRVKTKVKTPTAMTIMAARKPSAI